ncbi:MAG: AbgT family transporter [Dehalococcoidia bacterium]
MTAENTAIPAPAKRSLMEKMLDGIEKVGNKVPHPVIIFLALCGIVIVLSHVFYVFGVSVTYDVAEPREVTVAPEYVGGSVVPEFPVSPEGYETDDFEIHTKTTRVQSLLTIDGIRFLFTSFVPNFAGFGVVAVIFVAMIGVGVAEEAGLMGALIRKLVMVAPRRLLAFIIILVGGLSSIATDAGYLILIPLGAAAFLSVGRHPLAGLAAAYAGVSVAFAVNILITPLDSMLTEVTNEAIQIAVPGGSIGILSNFYFSAISTIFTSIVVAIVTERIIEKRLGAYQGKPDETGAASATADTDTAEAAAKEAKGLRYALFGTLGMVAVVLLAMLPPGAPLRHPETGAIIGMSPFMDSLVFIISLVFLFAGLGYGIGAKTFKNSVDVINGVVKTFASLAGLVFMLLIISQFIAYFNYSNMPTIAAVGMADVLEQMSIGPIFLLIGMIVAIMILDLIIPGSLPKWAIFAPIFVPLFIRLGVAPQTVLAAYRIGDSPMNVITPLMVYLPFIVVTAQRYDKSAGLGTIISLMLPYTVIIMVTWILFFVLWFLLGVPLGPGYPVAAG